MPAPRRRGSAPPGRGRSSRDWDRDSCGRRCADREPPPRACSGPVRAAFGGTGSFELPRDLVLRFDALIAGRVADLEPALDVVLVTGLALPRMLPWGRRVGVRIGGEEVRHRISGPVRLVAG